MKTREIAEMIEAAIETAMGEVSPLYSTEKEKAVEVFFKKEAGANKPVEVRIHASAGGAFVALCELTMAWVGTHPEEMRESCIELLREQCLRELREGSGKEDGK